MNDRFKRGPGSTPAPQSFPEYAMDTRNMAAIEFCLSWRSAYARHRDRYYIGRVDFWRDILPDGMEKSLLKMVSGQAHESDSDYSVFWFLKMKVVNNPMAPISTRKYQGIHRNDCLNASFPTSWSVQSGLAMARSSRS